MADDRDRQRAWAVHQGTVLLAGALIPAIGLAYRVTAPDEHDPLSHRLGFAAAAAGLVLAERRWPALRPWGDLAAFAIGAAFVAWFGWTASLAGFSVGRVMGLFTLQFGGTLLFRSPLANLGWQGVMGAVTAVGLARAELVHTSPAMASVAMATIATMSVATSVAGDRTLRALESSRRSLAEAHDRLEERVRVRTSALRREVEERRSAEERAEAANVAKSRFLANMSHELRTPLNAIVGYTELVRESFQGASAEARDLDRVLASAGHLRALIDDVLDLARVEAGRVALRPGPFDLRAVVEEAAAAVEPQIRSHGNTLVRSLPADLPEVVADRDRVRQILVNLLDNAARFTSGGTVTVSAEVRDGLRVAVTDTGVGIAPEHLPRLFQRFSQVDESATRRHGGTGLGLALSQELARLHGARIEVQSAPGVGSTFTLVLPARALSAAA